jgi:F-box protein 11
VIKPVNRILVDEVNGPVRTIEEAMNRATENTVIKLCNESYRTKVRINKPGIKIEPREKDKMAYIMCSDGPVITIDLEEG